MSYSRIKVWIAAEVLTASDLNNEHDGHITNENDLDTRLISEITTRSALETEHDTFYAACWNPGSSEIAANRVSNNSMKDDSVGFAELKSECNNPAASTPGLRSLGVLGVVACAGNDQRLSDQRVPTNSSVTTAKLGNINAAITQVRLKTSMGGVGSGDSNLILPGGQYGFYPQVRMTDTDSEAYDAQILKFSGAGWITFVTNIYLKGTTLNQLHAQQRYITSSGEIHWIFILRDKITKKNLGMYQAPDHPCFGNGGKPLLVPHPFLDFDETKHEIIVINPTNEEIEQMELEAIVEDETKPDKNLLEIITENYEIDEASNPAWPSIPVTVGLPKYTIDKKGKKTLVDYRFMGKDDVVEPIKKIILKPDYIKVRRLKKK